MFCKMKTAKISSEETSCISIKFAPAKLPAIRVQGSHLVFFKGYCALLVL